MAKKPILTFQVEPEEEEAIKEYLKEHGIKKRSPFLREAVFRWIRSDQPQLTREMVEEFKAWRKEFHGVGSNLNQISYRLNADLKLSTQEILDILEELSASHKSLSVNMKRLRRELKL